MKIISFTMVNNESEIIESFIRYNYNFVDDSSTSCININIDNSLKEVHELKKDFEKIKEENEILQKAMSILAKKN